MPSLVVHAAIHLLMSLMNFTEYLLCAGSFLFPPRPRRLKKVFRKEKMKRKRECLMLAELVNFINMISSEMWKSTLL